MMAIPLEVKRELAVAVALAPLIKIDLRQPWSPTVFMTDASEEGGAVVETIATTSEMHLEGRQCVRGGWERYRTV